MQSEVGHLCLCNLSLLLIERAKADRKKLALEFSNKDETACNSGGHHVAEAFVLKAFRQLGDVVPRHGWVSQRLLKTKSSPIVGEQGNQRVELW